MAEIRTLTITLRSVMRIEIFEIKFTSLILQYYNFTTYYYNFIIFLLYMHMYTHTHIYIVLLFTFIYI